MHPAKKIDYFCMRIIFTKIIIILFERVISISSCKGLGGTMMVESLSAQRVVQVLAWHSTLVSKR